MSTSLDKKCRDDGMAAADQCMHAAHGRHVGWSQTEISKRSVSKKSVARAQIS